MGVGFGVEVLVVPHWKRVSLLLVELSIIFFYSLKFYHVLYDFFLVNFLLLPPF